MNAQTSLSAKGQVVIPKDVRVRLHWEPGQKLSVIETGDGVFLRTLDERPRISFEEFRARVPRHEGPPATIAEMNAAVDRMFAEQEQP